MNKLINWIQQHFYNSISICWFGSWLFRTSNVYQCVYFVKLKHSWSTRLYYSKQAHFKNKICDVTVVDWQLKLLSSSAGLLSGWSRGNSVTLWCRFHTSRPWHTPPPSSQCPSGTMCLYIWWRVAPRCPPDRNPLLGAGTPHRTWSVWPVPGCSVCSEYGPHTVPPTSEAWWPRGRGTWFAPSRWPASWWTPSGGSQ